MKDIEWERVRVGHLHDITPRTVSCVKARINNGLLTS